VATSAQLRVYDARVEDHGPGHYLLTRQYVAALNGRPHQTQLAAAARSDVTSDATPISTTLSS
jgi:hypothetical protein